MTHVIIYDDIINDTQYLRTSDIPDTFCLLFFGPGFPRHPQVGSHSELCVCGGTGRKPPRGVQGASTTHGLDNVTRHHPIDVVISLIMIIIMIVIIIITLYMCTNPIG